MPANLIDPNMQALMKLYPAPNADPNVTGGYNYVQSEIFNQNNYQWTTRGDYNVSDNTKIFVRYNMQRETAAVPGWVSGGAMAARCRIRPRSRVRTAPIPSPEHSPMYSARP